MIGLPGQQRRRECLQVQFVKVRDVGVQNVVVARTVARRGRDAQGPSLGPTVQAWTSNSGERQLDEIHEVRERLEIRHRSRPVLLDYAVVYRTETFVNEIEHPICMIVYQ